MTGQYLYYVKLHIFHAPNDVLNNGSRKASLG